MTGIATERAELGAPKGRVSAKEGDNPEWSEGGVSFGGFKRLSRSEKKESG